MLCRGSTDAPHAGDRCSAVKLQLHRPLADLRVLITAQEPHPLLRGLSTGCSFSASIFDSQSAADLQNCSLAEDIASGPSAHEERWLRIHGACSEASISIEVRCLPNFKALQVTSQPCGAAVSPSGTNATSWILNAVPFGGTTSVWPSLPSLGGAQRPYWC